MKILSSLSSVCQNVDLDEAPECFMYDCNEILVIVTWDSILS